MELWESVVRMVSALGVVLALILVLLAVARFGHRPSLSSGERGPDGQDSGQ